MEETKNLSNRYLVGLNDRPANIQPATNKNYRELPFDGKGTLNVLKDFEKNYYQELTASSGPRSFGYVVGGATPASIVGDWLTSVFDQDNGEGITVQLEDETIAMARELFGLSQDFFGSFVSGATMSNFVGLASARQWVAQNENIDIAETGLYKLNKIKVFSASPHSSIYKSLSMLGMGRNSLIKVNSEENSEAIDIKDLERKLAKNTSLSNIVVANAGTVNSTSFDDFKKIVELKSKYNFWLHIDGAFGLFANCSTKFSHLLDGVNNADSIVVDAHKWLNVPYDSAIHFTKHPQLQRNVFQNSNATYLSDFVGMTDYMNRTPETSRRLRALPVWFTLLAYGKSGYQEIVERNCEMASYLGKKVKESDNFSLLSPVNFNVVCFTINGFEKSKEKIDSFLSKLTENGEVFMTSTQYQNKNGIRAALCNWRTEKKDMEIVWNVLKKTIDKLPVPNN
ncbi:pyridoxal phosphate-dependent decarboxylase family protein [Aquimarina sp. 2-A2]|uniref:pyridoxal phosphate-dependent decarboxylase family protein n=1 Tax=Aquimarina sp. 2-A2 TaxID=3382644 RepID=UPI00387F08C6